MQGTKQNDKAKPGQPTPVLDRARASDMNLSVLKRIDPEVEEVRPHLHSLRLLWDCSRFRLRPTLCMQVLANAGHVCLYRMSVEDQQWVSVADPALACHAPTLDLQLCTCNHCCCAYIPPWHACMHACMHAMHQRAAQPISLLPTILQHRKNIEGTLFLIKRRTQPRFQMIVLNKLSTGETSLCLRACQWLCLVGLHIRCQ